MSERAIEAQCEPEGASVIREPDRASEANIVTVVKAAVPCLRPQHEVRALLLREVAVRA